jgi:predicted AAA+ superfamily ATPase
MKTRYLQGPLEQLCFSSHKMAFVSGPRQCGKTTMAKLLLVAKPGVWREHAIGDTHLTVASASEALSYLP